MKKVEAHVRFMVDNGLIFEINRKVLHPLGLALEVGVHPDNSKWLSIRGLVSVDDGDDEGFIYDEEGFNVGSERYELYLTRGAQKMLDSRKEKLGYIIQEKPNIAKTVREFHFGGGKDPYGRDFSYFMSNSMSDINQLTPMLSHSFIQWMYPNIEPSSVNLEAPVLTPEDIKEFNNGNEIHINFLYEWFYEFLKHPDNHDTIFGQPVDHNHLRITRVLNFFNQIGQFKLAKELFNYCINSAQVEMDLAISYWKEAIGEQV